MELTSGVAYHERKARVSKSSIGPQGAFRKRNARTGLITPRQLPRDSWHSLAAENDGDDAHRYSAQRICAWRWTRFLPPLELVTTYNVGPVSPDNGNEAFKITCDSSWQGKRKWFGCLGRIGNGPWSPARSLRNTAWDLHTDLANTSTHCGIVGRIDALLHNSFGGHADLVQRGGITRVVLALSHEIDDTLTIIYGTGQRCLE